MRVAGLAEPARELSRAAVLDAASVARYRATIVAVSGASCLLWSHALSGRGHGQVWLDRADGRDVVVVAHRFAYTLEHGVDALEHALVLGHRCDNPLSGSGPALVEASTAWRNRQEWVLRRDTIGGALRDARGARGDPRRPAG